MTERTDDEKTKNDDRVIVVALPVASPTKPVEGSTVGNCARCGEPVWIAPSTRALEVPYTLSCLRCTGQSVETSAEFRELFDRTTVAPGAFSELLTALLARVVRGQGR
jgi:hypothetical protein